MGTVATPVSTTPTSSTSLKQMSWPEQLARHKAARSTPAATASNSTNSTTTPTTTTTGQQRHSIDSMDSMEMELAGSESLENGVSNPAPPPPTTKKAIILPILGKKKNLLTPTSAVAAIAVPSPSSTSGPSSVSKENSSKISDADLCTTADSKMSKSEFAESSSGKKRGPGRPKKGQKFGFHYNA